MLPITEQVRIRTFSTEKVEENLASIKRFIDVYCWYEGSEGLPKSGADWMKTSLFEPIFRAKKDLKLNLYSLGGWNPDKKYTLATMPNTTPLGESINQINSVALECIYSFSFFRFCVEARKNKELYAFISDTLPKKEWLKAISADRPKSGKTVCAQLDNQPSLFDSIQELDFEHAYPLMQYVEGYYLIRELVRKSLLKGERDIEVAFVLPRGEEKYYNYDNFSEFRSDVERMLQLDFKETLRGIQITFSFQFFRYKGSINSRPYIDRWSGKVQNIGSYFNFLNGEK